MSNEIFAEAARADLVDVLDEVRLGVEVIMVDAWTAGETINDRDLRQRLAERQPELVEQLVAAVIRAASASIVAGAMP